MLFYYLTVAPEYTHPHFQEIEGGYAHCFLNLDIDPDLGERAIRELLQKDNWLILENLGVWQIDEEHSSLIPQEAKEQLKKKLTYVEIIGYEHNGGNEPIFPKRPSWLPE